MYLKERRQSTTVSGFVPKLEADMARGSWARYPLRVETTLENPKKFLGLPSVP